MENVEQNLENNPHAGALSIYGQADAAMDDFPVLKAFQQYIDAEQSKSRKRMILLCMFFGALMTILVAVFVFMLAQASRDKQHVNDQLIQFLMKERERPQPTAPQQTVVQQPVSNPAQEAALKAMTETLAALQQQIADQKKADDEKAAAQPTKAELERDRRAAEEKEKIKRAQEKLEAEKRKLADEKEKLRQAEIERQRRRLYPEYYQKLEQGVQQPPSQVQSPSIRPVPKKRELTDADIDDILREVDSLKAEEEAEAAAEKKAKEKAKKAAKAKAAAEKKAKVKKAKKKAAEDADEEPGDEETKLDKPIEYFNDSEYALPVKVNGEESSWSLSLE